MFEIQVFGFFPSFSFLPAARERESLSWLKFFLARNWNRPVLKSLYKKFSDKAQTTPQPRMKL